jgi:adenylate cyclase
LAPIALCAVILAIAGCAISNGDPCGRSFRPRPGARCAWKGDDAIAVEQANRALRLSPFDPWLYMPYIGLAYAHFAAGRFEETVAAASLATQPNPRFSVPQILHAAALGSLDRSEDAKTVVQRLLELQPGITVATAILSARYINPKNIDVLENALRRAGLPER